MAKRFTYVMAIIFALAVSTLTLFACSGDKTYKVKYTATEGGCVFYIDQQGYQNDSKTKSFTVNEGDNVIEITAKPDKGYTFEKWSDGVTTATRQDKNVQSDISVTASFKIDGYTLTYTAGEHGRIDGETEQVVARYCDGSVVKAMPDKGYMFVKWSDGVTTVTRQETSVNESIQVTAEFELISREYKLNYRINSDSELNKQSLKLTYDKLDGIKLPVLQKERFTFGGWYYDGQMVANENGELVIDDEFLIDEIKKDGSDRNIDIKAKWTAEETFSFKILVVYVTKINADLLDRNRNMQHVEFEMTDLQKEFCHATTKLLKHEMDDTMDGLVDFQVDEYFTTRTVTTECFQQGFDKPGSTYLLTDLFPSYIPEVKEKSMIDGYDAAVSVFGFCEDLPTTAEADRFQAVSGAADPKQKVECWVDFDGMLVSFTDRGATSIAQVLNGAYRNEWLSGIETFRHEIAHLIEMRIHCSEYHKAISGWVDTGIGSILASKLYYLNELIRDGQRLGVPYGFWKGEVAHVSYGVTSDKYGNMGYISLNEQHTFVANGNEQEVVYGYDALAVKAEPFPGYRFVKWSDGVTTPERKDSNITADFTVTAIFEPIVYTLKIVAGEGGCVQVSGSSDLENAITIEVKRGSAVTVDAVAQEGYRFVGWSDGTTDRCWNKRIQITELEKFDENSTYVLTAIFEKIEES